METFVLLPFFLLSRIPANTDVWRHGPEYTFVVHSNVSTLEDSLDSSAYQVDSTLKCRPLEPDTLRCQFGSANITIRREPVEVHDGNVSWYQAPFNVQFDRRGIKGLVFFREIGIWNLNLLRAFVSQMNVGVDLLHKPDGAFQAMQKSYFGQCEGLVRVSHEARGNKGQKKRDHEIVTISGIEKKRGDVLVIEKTMNVEKCMDQDFLALLNEGRKDMQLLSRSRIAVSDMDYDAYTENKMTSLLNGYPITSEEKIYLNLVSVLPAQEPLQPLSGESETISPFIYQL